MALFGLFTESENKKAFELGYNSGMEEGIRIGMSRNFERSVELSESEYKEVIDFLSSRGLELCCYDVFRGGFRVRKRI